MVLRVRRFWHVRHGRLLRLGLLELASPDFLNSCNVCLAEVEPALLARALRKALLSFVFIFVSAILVVKSLLCDVTKLNGDLDNLPQVHSRADSARGVMEVGVTFELVAHERLHGLQVLFIESLSHQIEDLKALLVRNGAELESSCHVEHSLNDLLAKDVV